MLTHDRGEAAAYDSDPLITRRISVGVLLGLHDASSRLVADARAINVPTLIFSAGRDYVVERGAQERFFAGLSSRRKKHEIIEGSYHAVFYEKGRQEVAARTREFISGCFSAAPETAADAAAETEYQRLGRPAGLAKRAFYGLQVLGMKTLGRMSRGISIGLETGFNSGRSLDHVYRNSAEGKTFLGRVIDRGYLNATGWRGVRTRRQQLQAQVARAAGLLAAKGRPARVLDVASGPGRYLLEVKRAWKGEMSMLLRDRDPANLASGRALAAEWGLRDVEYTEGDAFAPGSYSGLPFKPNIVVVSGLYELFPENGPLEISLKAIAGAIEPGGYLVYTGQPWHPQLEMIARTLTGYDGKPWIMRCRPQAELNRLAAEAGFSRVDSSIDPTGIFTVSLAVR